MDKAVLRSILLIDDDSATNFIHKLFIQRVGLAQHIVMTTSASDALEFLQGRGPLKGEIFPELILLDLNMPNMNGEEFLEIYSKLTLKEGLPPVIIVSSSREKENKIMSKFGIVKHYLSKPVRKEVWKDLGAELKKENVGNS